MIQLIKTHKWAVLLALLAGVITAFPQFYFPYDHSEQYQGIYIANTDNEAGYLVRIQEVRDGHLSLGNAVLKEGKDYPYIQPPLGEILVAYLGKIFFLDLNNTILLARFLFPILGFLLIYCFVFLITKEKLTGLAAAAAFILGGSLISRGALFALLQGEAQTGFLYFYRPISPQTGFLFFISFLLFFWLFFSRRRWIWGVISALILGLSFYAYPYTWSFIYAFLGVLCLILLFQKKWQEIKSIVLIALSGIIIGIPYFLNLYEGTLHPFFQEIGYRFRLFDTHRPIFGVLVPSMFIIFLLFFPRKWRERYIFSLALFITPFIVLNQQIITGKEFSSAKYHWVMSQPLAVIFLVIIFLYQIKFWQGKLNFLKNVDISKILVFLIIGVSVYTGIVVQSASYKESEELILSRQRYGPVVKWLALNTKKEEVVLADPYQSEILPIYTSLNQFYSGSSLIYLSASNERMLESVFLFYRLDGVSGKSAKTIFLQKEERVNIAVSVYGIYYKNISGSSADIPDELLLSLAEKYQDFLLIPIDKIFKMYDIKYVVWDKKNYPKWQLDKYPFLSKIHEEGDFVIYKN